MTFTRLPGKAGGAASQPGARARGHCGLVTLKGALVALLLSALTGGAAIAQSSLPVPLAEGEAWKELDASPPAYPQAANLVRFPTSWTNNGVFVDTSTLHIGADTVVRYVLVIKTAGGAENVTYEALRCETGQRRVYAFGRRDGTWSLARRSDWQLVNDARINRHYFEFWRDLFCDGKSTERREDILRNLPRGGRERQLSIPSE